MSTSINPNDKSNAAPLPPVDTAIPNLPRFCEVTTVGLTIKGDVTFDQWAKAVDAIVKRGKGYQWQHGDALLEGERRFGESYAQVIDPLDEDAAEYSRKHMQVAGRFPPGSREPRRSWSHHRAAAFFDTLEERCAWVQLSLQENWSVHDLEKAIKESKAEPQPEPDPDLYVLQDPAVRAFLEGDKEKLNAQLSEVPDSAGFLRDLIHGRIDATEWQLRRTLESDQDEVRDGVSEVMGTAYQVFLWLKARARLISPPDVRVYLGILKEAGRITEEKDEKPNSSASGTTVTVYKPKRNDYDNKRDDEKRAKVIV